jgi:DNA-binding transcriptional LysR family regulator
VLRNRLDIAVTIMPAEDERITRIPLYSEQFYLVVPVNHELANKDHIDFNEVRGLPLIIFPQNHQCRKLIDSACHAVGIAISPVIETNTVESILQLVKNGTGFSILSKTLLSIHHDSHVKKIKIENPSLCRQIGVIYHKDKYLGHAARKFIELLKEHVGTLQLALPTDCGNEDDY